MNRLRRSHSRSRAADDDFPPTAAFAFVFVARFAGSGESGARAPVVLPREASRTGLARFADPGVADADPRAGGVGVTAAVPAVAARSASAKSAAAFSARRRRSESITAASPFGAEAEAKARA